METIALRVNWLGSKLKRQLDIIKNIIFYSFANYFANTISILQPLLRKEQRVTHIYPFS